jgi:exodeoxyribonuclease V beta subunit
VDFGSAEQDSWRRQAILEELAEKSRLLYVALTRAIYRCYIVWGNVRNASDPEEGLHSSALAWLLHGSPSKSDEDPMAALAARLEAMGQAGIETDLQAFSDRSKGNVHIAPATVDRQSCRPAAEQAEADLRPRKFAGPPLRACWRISSFTGIAIGRQSETPDYDATTDIDVDPSPDGSIFAFPRGARAGSCLHAILEEWDFTSTDRDRFELLTARKLRAHGLDTSWTKTVSECIVSALDRPLSGTGLRLRDIPSSRRLSELEFTFALAGENAQSLHSVLADPRFKCHPLFIEASFRLDPVFVAGYMRGYIDLVFEDRGKFYLADYKSNWLGGRASDYTKDRLAETMAREHYYLQYLIYALALHRYLQLRLPNYDYERHFGGIYYLFLRGMASSAAAGIFSDRPSAGLIRRLDELVS